MLAAYVPQASTYAGDIDFLFTIITLIVGFWFILTEVIFFAFLKFFKRKDGVKAKYISGESHEEERWIAIPHYIVIVFDVILIIGTVLIWKNIKQDMPEPEVQIKVIAQQWAWTFVHPGVDNKLGTDDDIALVDELHIKKGKNYQFFLESKDVMHSFSIPVFRLKQDAVPGRMITGWFNATKTGEYDIQCAEMCGVAHGIMGARLFISEEEEHDQWREDQLALKNKYAVK